MLGTVRRILSYSAQILLVRVAPCSGARGGSTGGLLVTSGGSAHAAALVALLLRAHGRLGLQVHGWCSELRILKHFFLRISANLSSFWSEMQPNYLIGNSEWLIILPIFARYFITYNHFISYK